MDNHLAMRKLKEIKVKKKKIANFEYNKDSNSNDCKLKLNDIVASSTHIASLIYTYMWMLGRVSSSELRIPQFSQFGVPT